MTADPSARTTDEAPATTTDATKAADVAHATKGGFTQLLGAIAQMLMPVYHVTVARLFGQATFGLYQYGLGVTDLAARLGWMGGDKAMHRFIAAHRADGEDELARRAFGGALRLTASVSAILAIALAFGASLVARLSGKPGLAAMLPVLSFLVVPATATMVLVAATLGRKVTRVSFLVRSVGEPIFLLGAAFVAYALGGGARALAAAHVSASTIGFVAAFVGACFVFGRSWVFSALRAPAHPKLVAFALPVAGSELGNAVLQKADFLVLGLFAPDKAVAIYVAAEFLGRIAANVRYAFDGIAAPMLSEALHLGDRERLRGNLAMLTRWVATLSVPLAVTMVGLRADLLSLYGQAYVAGASLVCVWTLTHLVNGTLGLVGHVLMMSGRSRTYFVNQAVAATLNVVLSLLLIPRFGMMGAAASALVAVTTPLVLMIVEVWVLERVHPFAVGLVKPFVAGAAMLAVELAVDGAVASRFLRIASVIGAGLFVYLIALALLRPGREERELVARVWARLRRA
ncbi:MAG TPA: oligosaccharide flippase family protein [Polyangia bacterium]|nr:oligosaccharide flippase family protein [Polyangia bacterium]